jgi:hypothetical protein
MMELYVIDDKANEDMEAGILRWLVTTDEDGEDYDMEVARFTKETDAEQFVAMKTER